MDNLLDRIATDPAVMSGKPVIRGTRLTVQYVVGLLAQGASVQEILDEYQGLAREDVQACLAFAEAALESAAFLPLSRAA